MGAVIASLDLNISQSESKSSLQTMVQNSKTYGFAYKGKIYLNPDVMNSETAIHEYTHLWDNYTQKTNPELWEKGKQIFMNTKLWNEVKSDPNYADIAADDDLVLSEVHSRLCGKIGDKILEKIIEQDGQLTADKAIDWDKETWAYIESEFSQDLDINSEELKQFLSMPLKDLMNGKNITQEINSVSQNDTSLSGARLRSDFMDNLKEARILQKNGDERWPDFETLVDDITRATYTESQQEELKSFILSYTESDSVEEALPRLEKFVDTDIAIDNGALWEYDEKHRKVLKEDRNMQGDSSQNL